MAKRRIPRGAVILLCVICILLALLSFAWIRTGTLRDNNATMERELTALKAEVSELAKEYNRQQAIIDEQKGTIEAQQGTIDDQHDTITEQENEITQQQGTIEEQQDKIEEQQGVIKDQKDTISDLQTQIALKETQPGDPNLPAIGPLDDYEGQKIVALTFDDGPGPYTAELLDFLKQEGVRATFFVLGTRVDAYPDLIRRMAAEGHEIGNHSNAHNMLHNMDLLGVRNEMGKCAEKIEKLVGYRPSIMRCPGGNKNDAVHQYAKEAGIPIAYWSVDTRDWESRNKDKILEVAFGKNGIKDGSIVLMHDIYKTTVEATKEMILQLKAEGYVFVTTSELIAARRGGIVAGKQYS